MQPIFVKPMISCTSENIMYIVQGTRYKEPTLNNFNGSMEQSFRINSSKQERDNSRATILFPLVTLSNTQEIKTTYDWLKLRKG